MDWDQYAEPFDDDEERLRAPRRKAAPVQPAEQVPTTRVVGRSADGSVVVVLEGREPVSTTLARPVADYPPQECGRQVASAVNAALAVARTTAPVAGDPLPDLGALLAGLTGAGAQGVHFLGQVDAALAGVVAKLGGRTGMTGDASPVEVGGLMAETTALVRDARDSLRGLEGPQVLVGGTDPEELVEVDIGPSGTVVRVVVSEEAAMTSAVPFGQAVCAAVSAALAEWTSRRELEEPERVPDLGAIGARAEALRDQSVDRLRGYARRLTSIMASVREP